MAPSRPSVVARRTDGVNECARANECMRDGALDASASSTARENRKTSTQCARP